MRPNNQRIIAIFSAFEKGLTDMKCYATISLVFIA